MTTKEIKKKISIEEIPENQVSNRILYIRINDKNNTIFPLDMEILVVNNKKGFKKQGKYLGQKINTKRDGVNYTFSFGGKITLFKYKFTDKKNELAEDYKFYIDTKSYKNREQKKFYCNLLEGKKLNFGFKSKITKEDIEKECVNFYKNQKIKFTEQNKKIIESEKKKREKQMNAFKKSFDKEIKKIKKETAKKTITKK
jgi:hypothetical protein